MMNRLWTLSLVLLMALGSLGLVACDQQGPAEERGEEIDETMEDAADRTGDAAEDVEDTFED